MTDKQKARIALAKGGAIKYIAERYGVSANTLKSWRKKTNVQAAKEEADPGFVYLFLNNRNGLVKIGYSTRPAIREKTLQSEEPDIEMIFCAPGTMKNERALHLKYSAKRVRGEWFKLTQLDIEEIKVHEFKNSI